MTVSKCLCGYSRCKSWVTTHVDGQYDKGKAHLLDSSHELLDALDAIILAIDAKYFGPDAARDRMEAITDKADAARAAIAKAKGDAK